MTYKTEFPAEYWPSDAEVALLESAGFVDSSWHNNISPSWVLAYDPTSRHISDDCVEIYIDAADPAMREIPDAPRFCVMVYRNGEMQPVGDGDAAYPETLSGAIELATELAADMFHLVNRG